MILRQIENGTLVLDARDRERLVALYDAGVHYHEHQLARLFDALVARDLLDDTMVIVTADHGEELFEHGSVGHGGDRLWESIVRIPLIVHQPGQVDARRITAPVGLVDVVPTVLEATGLPPAPGLAGRSMLELVDGRRDRGTAFAGTDSRRMILEGTLKLVERDVGEGGLRPRLFDVGTDVRQRDDLVATRPAAVELLHRRLLEGLEATSDRPAAATEATIDHAMAAQLRALGYAGGD
jgi:choline-sulfatase